MSGNQEPQISLPTWRCSDFNAAIPIKKRKFFVQPQLPAMEEAGSALVGNNQLPNAQESDNSVGRCAFYSSVADEIQNMIGGSKTNIGVQCPSVSVGNADKPESFGNHVFDQTRVKVEGTSSLIYSGLLAGFEIPSSSNIFGNSVHCSMDKLPMGSEHPGVAVTSRLTGMKVDQTVSETHDIVRETCGKENIRGECQTEESSGASTVFMRQSCKTNNNSPYWENEEPTPLNLPLRKGVCAPQNTDSVSICTKSGDYNRVNRSQWDLNTTTDAWEDAVDRTAPFKNNGAFLNSNRSLHHDIETSSCPDTTIIAKSVSENQNESVGLKSPKVTLTRFDNQVNPTCSLSLGLSSYPSVEKSPSLPAATLKARPACFSRPITGNVNSVNLRTVKSEFIEESVKVSSIGPSINRVKHEVVGRFSQDNSLSSDSLKPVGPKAIKVEPFSFTQSELFSGKDGTLNHPHTPITQTNKILDLPTSPTRTEKEKYIPYLSSISDAPMSLNGRTRETCVQSYPDYTLKENSGQSSSAANETLCEALKHSVVHMTCNFNESGVNVSLVEQRNIDVPFHSDFQNPNNVKEKESQPPLLGNTGNKHIKECSASSSSNEFKNIDESCLKLVEMAGTEVLIKRLTPELQSGIFDRSGDNEGRIVLDGEQSTHASGNVENPGIVDNISQVSYKAENSTIDNDTPAEFSEGRQSRIINLAQASSESPMKTLDASERFVSLRTGIDRLSDFSLEPRKDILRWSDESCKFSRGRYGGRVMRSPRFNFLPDKRRLSDNTESNLHDRDRKNFEFDNHGNTRRGGACVSNFRRGRRPADDEATSFSHSFTRRTSSFTQRESTNEEDASAFHGFRDGEKFTRGLQSNDMKPVFTSQPRPYRGRSGFARGRRSFSKNFRRGSSGFLSRSPIRSRKRSASPSSSFSNRSQEDFSDDTDFSHRRSPAGYRRGRISSPDHSGYPREMVVRRHNSPPYSHRPSNAGRGRGIARGRGYERGRGFGRGRGYARGRGYGRGRGYARGRGYGRDGISFWKPSYRAVHRDHGNLNNLDSREGVDYDDDFFEGPVHSERFGVDVNVERRQFGYRHDGTSSSIENDPDVVRFGQDSDTEIVEEQGSLMESDGKNKNSAENASGRTKNMEEEETSKLQ